MSHQREKQEGDRVGRRGEGRLALGHALTVGPRRGCDWWGGHGSATAGACGYDSGGGLALLWIERAVRCVHGGEGGREEGGVDRVDDG